MVTGCLHRPVAVRLAKSTPIEVAVLVDRVQAWTKSAEEVSGDEVFASLNEALEERNLAPRPASPELQVALQAARESKQRLQRFGENKQGDARLLLLMELKVVYYELLSGRYKWTVFAKLTIARRDDLAAASSVDVDVPVFLLYDHEREAEALRAATPALAERASALIDSYLRGRPDLLSAAASPKREARNARGAFPQSLYFIIVDRFQNGDRSNDSDAKPSDPEAFHGGDLQGVIDRLDWLQAVGVEAVWLSPVFAMRTKPFFGHGAFHGYWTEDLGRVEPRFGDTKLLRKLSDELHARGMMLVLDLVLNHVAMDGALTREHPEWFHGKGPIKDWNDPRQLEEHDVHGLPDLAQERDDVYRYLLATSLKWIDAVKPDGFRLDAVKHVSTAFWKRFNRDIKAHAGRDFWLVGEALDGEPHKLAALLRDGGFDALFDFPLKHAITDVVCKGKPLGRLAATLSLDSVYDDAGAQLVTLVDNHDLPRIVSECGGDVEKAGRALEILLSLRGTPSIQYGTEVGLEGKAEPANRGDMRFIEHPLLDRIARWLKLRARSPALRFGGTRVVHLDGDSLVLERGDGDGSMLVAIHLGGSEGELRTRGAVLRLPPQSVSILPLLSQPRLPGAAAAASRLVEVSVRAPVGSGETLCLLGAGPDLGSWDPTRGLPLGASVTAAEEGAAKPGVASTGGPRWSRSLQLRAGAVYQFKLILKRRDGTVAWEPGEDRFLFVDDGPGTLRVEAELRTWST